MVIAMLHSCRMEYGPRIWTFKSASYDKKISLHNYDQKYTLTFAMENKKTIISSGTPSETLINIYILLSSTVYLNR